MEATMTNEEIAKKYSGWGSDGLLNIYDLMNLARQDEREKMTEEKVKGYLGGLGGKESALIVLNYLLRGGITDDDLRGLRLQWIKDEREKMQGVEVWVSVDKVDAVISTDEPEKYEQDGANFFCNYGYAIGVNVQDFANFLGVGRGQCKKVRIVEVT